MPEHVNFRARVSGSPWAEEAAPSGSFARAAGTLHFPAACAGVVVWAILSACSNSSGEAPSDGGPPEDRLPDAVEVEPHVGCPPPAPAERPTFCVPAMADVLQEYRDTPASPYYVSHPATDRPDVATVVYLGGGSGSETGARRLWDRYLSKPAARPSFRIVIPYADTSDYLDEVTRTFRIVDEILICHGGDPAKVHVAGASNGGRGAFGLMMLKPQCFASLLGAPGLFPRQDPPAWGNALGRRPVFNGVGSEDTGWKPLVMATHEALVAQGVDSVYVEFAGEMHSPSASFDAGIFFDFWSRR